MSTLTLTAVTVQREYSNASDAGWIPDEQIEVIREAIRIEELAGEYVDLRRSGQNYMGLCPFHDERTGSFSVSPARQTYHCFGCGVHGDVFDFIGRIENTDFRGAVEILASRAGISISTLTAEETSRIRQERKQAREIAQAFHDSVVLLRGEYSRLLHRCERAQWEIGKQLRDCSDENGKEKLWTILSELAPHSTRLLATWRFLNYSDTPSLIQFAAATPEDRRAIVLNGAL